MDNLEVTNILRDIRVELEFQLNPSLSNYDATAKQVIALNIAINTIQLLPTTTRSN